VDAVQRRFLADGAGNDDQGNIEVRFLQQVYGFKTAEVRQVVVAQMISHGAFSKARLMSRAVCTRSTFGS